jgi:hypothetical protein
MTDIDDLFKVRLFDQEVILLAREPAAQTLPCAVVSQQFIV